MVLKYNITLPSVEITEKKVIKALRKELNALLNKVATKTVVRVRKLIRVAIEQSPEYQSIKNGLLQGELGLPDPAVIDQIIDIWTNSVIVKVRPVRFSTGKITGGFRITAIDRDWRDVLVSPDASIVTSKGQVLPWLEWLLIHGNKTIVRDYDVVFGGRGIRRSRSGKAIMIKGKGKRWRVPPQFSGTTGKNFVTRSLEAVQPQVQAIIEKEVLKQVK